MSTVTEFIRFLVRGGLAAAVAALNETPKARELILETDTDKLKAGNGSTDYVSLPYLMRDDTLTLSDITTNNATTSRHGFLKKLDNDPTHFMNGQGDWATPAGAGGAVSLIGTATVAGAAATTLTLTGISMATYKALILVAELKNNTASDASISMYFGTGGGAEDTTATNYDRNMITNNTATVGLSVGNDSFIGSLRASKTLSLRAEIANDINGKPTAHWRTRERDGSAMEHRVGVIMWRTAANISSIKLSSAVANALAIGSKFSVYGML